ncbi:MAG: YicC/YloC family endoribonuclease [Phycisphaerales bacterium]
MIRSMTGFGAASGEFDGNRFVVEIRAVNGKFYKSTLRLPDELLALEGDIDQLASKRLGRGSVTIAVRFTPAPGALAATIDRAALVAYLAQLDAAIPAELRDRCTIDASQLLGLPGVIAQSAGTDDRMLGLAREAISKLVVEACDRLVEMRQREGAGLAVQLRDLGGELSTRLERIATRSPEVVVGYRERLRTRIDALLAESGTALREEDLLREVAIYADRSDIAEEVIRLRGHLAQLEQVLTPTDGRPAGRVLDFLAQEMLREANTIASKSSDAEITREVVEIKGLIERIKEQAQNVE